MKELCELYTETLNPPLMSFLQKITQYQFTRKKLAVTYDRDIQNQEQFKSIVHGRYLCRKT